MLPRHHVPHRRCREPEGRRRQDHDVDQSRCVDRLARLSRAAVDFDPQGNASSGVGYPRDKVELTVYDALVGECSLEEVIRPTDIPTLFLAPATTDLVGAEIELIGAERRERFLANALAPDRRAATTTSSSIARRRSAC